MSLIFSPLELQQDEFTEILSKIRQESRSLSKDYWSGETFERFEILSSKHYKNYFLDIN